VQQGDGVDEGEVFFVVAASSDVLGGEGELGGEGVHRKYLLLCSGMHTPITEN